MHYGKYYLHDSNRDSHVHNFLKNGHPHICCRTFTSINAAETSNYIITTETVICIIAAKKSTRVNVGESTTNITATEPQKLLIATDVGICIIAIESVSCIIPTDTVTWTCS